MTTPAMKRPSQNDAIVSLLLLQAFALTREQLAFNCRNIEQLPKAVTSGRLNEKLLGKLRHNAARQENPEIRQKMGMVLDFVLKQLEPKHFDHHAMKYLRTSMKLARQTPILKKDGSIDHAAMVIGESPSGSILSLPVRFQELEVAAIILKNARPDTPVQDISPLVALFCEADKEMNYNITRCHGSAHVAEQTRLLRTMTLDVLTLAHKVWPQTATSDIKHMISASMANEENQDLKNHAKQYLSTFYPTPKISACKQSPEISAHQQYWNNRPGFRFRVVSEDKLEEVAAVAEVGQQMLASIAAKNARKYSHG